MGDENVVHGGYHVVLDFQEEFSLLFYSVTPPSGSLDTREFKTWDAQGLPINSIGGGRQVTWSPVTLSKGVDTDNKLYEWFKTVLEKGATAETKKDVKITVMAEDGTTTLHIWNLTGAVITDYGHSASNAQTNEVLVQNITLKYENATLEAG
jgi:phage tail-like protein